MRTRPQVGPGGDRRSVTVTFGYGAHLRTLVAKNLRAALAAAEARWGRWETIESISTPDTIYSDVTGYTRARLTPGAGFKAHHYGTLAKLRGIGYEPAPGEIGSVRYARTELPKTYRHTRRPDTRTPLAFDDDESGKRANREG